MKNKRHSTTKLCIKRLGALRKEASLCPYCKDTLRRYLIKLAEARKTRIIEKAEVKKKHNSLWGITLLEI